ncbi:MAG: hypothetical protein QM479_10550 [Pseudomonadota bacterium]
MSDKNIALSVFSSINKENQIQIKLAVFFEEIVSGCSCGDPIMNIHNNCEMLLEINKKTSQAKFILL